MVDLTVDAGHGGKDPGAVGPTGVREKDVTLKLALKVGNLVTSRGATVNYTRTNDIFVELDDRAVIANIAKAKFFLSIHINSAANPAAHGTETYAYSKGGQAEQLAKEVQKSLVTAIGLSDRGIKFASYSVLRETNMPAVLTEVNFICNTAEEAMLKDEAFLNRAAIGIAKGVVSFLGLKWETSPIEIKKGGEESMLEKAILLFTEADKDAGFKVAARNENCALFVRKADRSAPAESMQSKKLFVIGGGSVGHPNETVLSGKSWAGTAYEVGKYLGDE